MQKALFSLLIIFIAGIALLAYQQVSPVQNNLAAVNIAMTNTTGDTTHDTSSDQNIDINDEYPSNAEAELPTLDTTANITIVEDNASDFEDGTLNSVTETTSSANQETEVIISPELKTTEPETGTGTELAVVSANVSVLAGERVALKALVNGTLSDDVVWYISEGNKGGAIDSSKIYTAPDTAGVFHIVGRYYDNPNVYAIITVYVESKVEKPAIIREITPTTTKTAAETTSTENVVSNDLQNINIVFEGFYISIDETEQKLIQIIDQKISRALKLVSRERAEEAEPGFVKLRQGLAEKIKVALAGLDTISQEEVDNLALEIKVSLQEIDAIISGILNQQTIISLNEKEITKIVEDLNSQKEEQAGKFKDQGGELLYRDTNDDGISDYESLRVYNLDPEKPSPVSEYQGRKIGAFEKILLGFDPTKEELVEMQYEEPEISLAPEVKSYKVDEIKLSEEKKVVITGRSLPNSFITLYIYSTPIIVTVKTDNNGEWEYTLDKELDTGEHIVYSATVDNSGKILAKSPGYIFTKTAEAATLGTLSQAETGGESEKPGLFENKNFFLILALIIAAVIAALVIIGLRTKEPDESGIERFGQ